MRKSLQLKAENILFVGAHPDDIELGCGALIASLAQSSRITCITLSDNQKNPALNHIIAEHFESMKILGVPKENIILGNFETRRFLQQRQEILEFLILARKKYEPQAVFVHSPADLHQDHGVVTQESLRAFRGITVFGFDVIRSSQGFFPNFLMEVTQNDLEKKILALKAYRTYADKYYFNPDLTKAILIRNGALCEKELAEGFDILRMVASPG
jgi:LmbE family N-acetylglucosaminyl deacetylase